MTLAKTNTAQPSAPLAPSKAARAAVMTQPPSRKAKAAFASEFGQRVLLTVDTEEEFDWNKPFTRSGHGLLHVPAIARFQAFCERINAHPVYLVDWPIANDPAAIEIIGDAVTRGKADIGVQLHPWVNPPFDEELSVSNSFAGNLSREVEAAKFMQLRARIERSFGKAPQVYRAGRYGLGPNTADILKAGGITIDTSVRPLFDYSAQGGPDYSKHPAHPYWVDETRSLLELPMTVLHWGALRQLGPSLQQAGGQLPPLLSALSRLRMLERIAATPEGVTAQEALRAVDLAIDQGLPCIVLSFHSPSLMAGFTPYTKTQSDVDALYAWFEQIYEHLAQRGVQSARVEDVWAGAVR